MRLFDYADGIEGHFCIGRQMTKYVAETWEFYNKGMWCSAGQVFKSKAAAEFVMLKLKRSIAKATGKQPSPESKATEIVRPEQS